MKNIITPLAFLFLLSASASALCDSTHAKRKHELGLILYSNWVYDFSDIKYGNFNHNFIPGIQYKLKLNKKNALRASAQFSYAKTNIASPSEQIIASFEENSKTKGIELRAGYERVFHFGKFKPYVFSDLLYSYQHTKGYKAWSGCFDWGAGNFVQTDNSFGIVTGAGLKYNLCRHVFISVETAFSLFYHYRYEKVDEYTPYSNHFLDWRIKPVNAFTLGVKF